MGFRTAMICGVAAAAIAYGSPVQAQLLGGGGLLGGDDGLLGGVVSTDDGSDGLLNVEIGGTNLSVLPGGGDTLAGTGLGGTGVGVTTSGGGSTGVSLGGGPSGGSLDIGLGGGNGATVSLPGVGGGGGSPQGPGGGVNGANGGNGVNGGNGGNGASGQGTLNLFLQNGRGGGGNGAGGSGATRFEQSERLTWLADVIRSRNWMRLGQMACSMPVEVVDVQRYLGREARGLPGVMSALAGEIGMLQASLASDPGFRCVLAGQRVNPGRVVALGYSGSRIMLLVV